MKHCRACKRSKFPISYSSLYNCIYASKKRETLIQSFLRKSRVFCMKHQHDILRHLKTMLTTQYIFDEDCKKHLVEILEKEIQNSNTVFEMRLRRFQRKVCKFLYRPNSMLVNYMGKECVGLVKK